METNMEALPKNNSLIQKLLGLIRPKVNSVESDYRFEKKFLVPLHELPQFEMRLHQFFCHEIYKARWINNLYCDTYHFQHFNENTEGYSDRKKLRFRWYGEANGSLKITAEFKIKHDDVNRKTPLNIGQIEYLKADTPQVLFEKCINSWQKIQPQTVGILTKYQPTLINRYHRRYFLNADAQIRVTIDTPIHYQNAQNGIKASQIDHAIVELKSPSNHIIFTDIMPYQLDKSSKYVDGLQRCSQ